MKENVTYSLVSSIFKYHGQRIGKEELLDKKKKKRKGKKRPEKRHL
jgi:hypothetical protein